MSICSRQYASRSISRLTEARASTLAASSSSPKYEAQSRQPIPFLDPSCPKPNLHRRYHTDPAPGRGNVCLSHHNRRSPSRPFTSESRAPLVRSSVAGQRKHGVSSTAFFSTELVLDSSSPSDVVKISSPKTKIETRGRPVYDSAQTARLSVSSDTSDPRAHYRQKIDALKVFFQLKTALRVDSPAGHNYGKLGICQEISKLEIPKEVAERLTGHDGSDTWIHHADSGCLITVTPATYDDTAQVQLQGSKLARGETHAHLTSNEVSTTSHSSAHTKKFQQWKEYVESYPAAADIRKLPDPPEWSVAAFHIYVCALTLLRPRRSANRFIYPDRLSYNRIATEKLVGMLTDNHVSSFASSDSVTRALQFCARHTELAVEAKSIWRAAEILGLHSNTSCYNQELGRCLLNRDNHRFTRLVMQMAEERVRPNAATWALALRYATDPDTRLQILKFCETEGILRDRASMPSMVIVTVRRDLYPYLTRPHGVSEFFSLMDAEFGSAWLNSSVLALMLRMCHVGKANVTSASDILANIARTRDLKRIVNRACVVELIRIAQKAQDFALAFEALQFGLVQRELDFHQTVLEPLFTTAWQARSLNVCRLLWICAATWGKITWGMRNRVWRSLSNNAASPKHRKLPDWRLDAGKLVVTRPDNYDRLLKDLPLLYDMHHDSTFLQILRTWTKNDRSRHEQIQLYQLLLEQDLNAWRFYKTLNLETMRSYLKKAIAMDQELSKSSAFETTPNPTYLDEVAGNMMHVPLIRRDAPVVADQNIDGRRAPFVFNGRALDYGTLAIDYYLPKELGASGTSTSTRVPDEDKVLPIRKIYPKYPLPAYLRHLPDSKSRFATELRNTGRDEKKTVGSALGYIRPCTVD